MIPADEVKQILKGRIANFLVAQLKRQGGRTVAVGETCLYDRDNKVANRKRISLRWQSEGAQTNAADEFLLMARLADPMLKITEVNAYVSQTEKVPQKADAEGWAKLAEATEVPLQIQDQFASGTYKLPEGVSANNQFAFQVSYINADGKPIYTQPSLIRLTFPEAPAFVTEATIVDRELGFRTNIRGGNGTNYRDVSENGLLVGMHLGLGSWGQSIIISSIQPIYRQADTDTDGKVWGGKSPSVITLVAKPGYAVGAINIKSAAAVDGLSIVFMKVAKGKLDPTDSYESEWVGGGGDLAKVRVGAGGRPIIGVVGKTQPNGDVGALGLAVKPGQGGK